MSKTIEELKMAFEKAVENHRKALEESYAMKSYEMECRIEFEQNKLVMGPIYWQLFTKLQDAEAMYKIAKEAEDAAEEALNSAEIELGERDYADDTEYYKNLKCTFCGELASECGGDHGDEMRDMCREKGW
jgi:hypothetical protein